MNPGYRFYVGIDWASEEHAVCILNEKREVLEQKKFEHTGSGLAQLTDRLLEISGGEPAAVAVGIETPRGAVVETLVERGFHVYSLNPKQMDRFRDRHTVPGAKDDSRDAYVIADSLATDLHLYHPVRLDEPLIIRIRELSRSEEDVKRNQTRTENQLRDLLNRYYPQMLKLCPAVNEAWFWDLIEQAPLPAAAGKLSKSKIQKLLSDNRIRRIDSQFVLDSLRVPSLKVAPGAAEAASEHVLLVLPLLRLLQQQAKDIAHRIGEVLEELGAEDRADEHRDVNILLSLPGVGQSVAATMLAEASQAIAERDYAALRSYAGIAPITRQSGKKKSVVMRQGCNGRLRNAFYHWSRVSTQHDARSKQHYAALRAKGHSHGRALRGITDRLLAVLVSMLKAGSLYDPARHAPAVQPAA